jgi:ornithine carbamoyltransferase
LVPGRDEVRGDEPDPDVVAWARETAAANGGAVEVHADPFAAASGAVVVSTDVWASTSEEAQCGRRCHALAAYRVDETLMASADPGAIFLHCLPARRGGGWPRR